VPQPRRLPSDEVGWVLALDPDHVGIETFDDLMAPQARPRSGARKRKSRPSPPLRRPDVPAMCQHAPRRSAAGPPHERHGPLRIDRVDAVEP